jgi:maltooligosyltrehalose trehalohydrolase
MSTPLETSPLPLLPVGAQLDADGTTYRVWAPDRSQVGVAIGGKGAPLRSIELELGADGCFVGHDPAGAAGDLYRFVFDANTLVPDVASRYQPLGVFGPSQVVDPLTYEWQVRDWRRPGLKGRVIYELHVGAFTRRGTFRAAIERLDHLAELGVNTIEIMPLADFPGRWNWGYDGVMLFAPARCYGDPDDLRVLVDAAHARGLAVVLDVVYNHLGPSGNHLPQYSERYFHPHRSNAWGRSFNLEGADGRHVRSFFVQNALYWLDEFRIDGLRLDATHAVEDESTPHFFAEIAAAVHSRGGFTIAEDERNEVKVLKPREAGGWGVDGVWADDFHHTIRVALTGQRESHFGSFDGTVDEWVDTLTHGWFYRGQFFAHKQAPRGSPCADLSPERFVFCISNHDQVGNRPLGERLHHGVSPEAYRAVSALLCLSPYTPMLFMGQEWGASTPFLFFTDHPPELGEKMAMHRIEEFTRNGVKLEPTVAEHMPDPQSEDTFRSSKLKWSERTDGPHAALWALYRECLELRAVERHFQNPPRDQWSVRKVGGSLLALRWHRPDGDWLLAMTLVAAGAIDWSADEFTAPSDGRRWKAVFHSNEARFGGPPLGKVEFAYAGGFNFSSPTTVLLREDGLGTPTPPTATTLREVRRSVG